MDWKVRYSHFGLRPTSQRMRRQNAYFELCESFMPLLHKDALMDCKFYDAKRFSLRTERVSLSQSRPFIPLRKVAERHLMSLERCQASASVGYRGAGAV